MNTKQGTRFEAELAEVKREVHERLKLKAASMNSDERARYRARLSADERKLFDRIVDGPRASASRERRDYLAEMDNRMGVRVQASSVKRSPHELSASVLGSAAPTPPRAGGTLVRKPATPARSATQSVATSHSAAAAEMDQRMGTGAGIRIRRSPRELVFSVIAD